MGPATVYWAPFGTTEPPYSQTANVPPDTWTDVGATADGSSVLLEIEHTLTDISAEQLVDPIGSRLSKRVIQVTAALEEATLQNLQLAMNQMLTLSSGPGYTVADPITTLGSTQPIYTALMIDGFAPTTGTTEVIVQTADARPQMPVLQQGRPGIREDQARHLQHNLDWVLCKFARFHRSS